MSLVYRGVMSQDTPELDLLLRPHRSLSPAGFWAIMGILALWSFAGGMVFLAVGAWPVVGFIGLDVALVWFAFRASYGDRRYERVQLTGGRLTVERVDRRGLQARHDFPSYWLRVSLEELKDGSNRLVLSSHGRHVAVGGFLSPGERAEIASMLQTALARAKAAPD
jgi:uncharacterized membrane protein